MRESLLNKVRAKNSQIEAEKIAIQKAAQAKAPAESEIKVEVKNNNNDQSPTF